MSPCRVSGTGWVFVTNGLGAGWRTKADGWLHASGRPPGAMPGTQTRTMDEWIAQTYDAMIEAWQREIVPGLLLGRAITFTIHAAPNQPARFDFSQHFKDPKWPAHTTPAGQQRKQ